MIPKPPSCQGCPFYGDGQGFVPDDVKPGRTVTVYAQNPGAEEEREGRPMIGKTGQLMDRVFLPLAGLSREDVNVANTIRCRVNGSNELPPLSDAKTHVAIKHCTQAHGMATLQATTLAIAQGTYALVALAGLNNVTTWRGWLLPMVGPTPARVWTPEPGDRAILVTLHIAALFRQPELQVPAKRDWAKVGQYLRGAWPEPMPEIITAPPTVWPAVSAFDTEFTWPGEPRLIRYSMAFRTPEGEPKVYVVEADQAWFVKCGTQPRVILHNTEADQDTLDGLLGAGQYTIDDTMHAHAVYAGGIGSETKERKERGSLHNLDFLGSLAAHTNRWKHLAQSNPIQYAGGDALGTWDVWHDLIVPAFRRDPQAEWIYRNRQLPLLPIIRRRRAMGIRLAQSRVSEAHDALGHRIAEAERQAQAACGYPINLGSPPQVAKQLYDIEQFGKRRQ